MMSDTRVRPFLKVVAHGRTASGARRMALLATPEPAVGDSKGFPLSEWPSRMAGLVAAGVPLDPAAAGTLPAFSVEIAVAPKAPQVPKDGGWEAARPDSGVGNTVVARAVALSRLGDPAKAPVWDDVDAIWQEAFAAGRSDFDWSVLSTMIEASLGGKRITTKPEVGAAPPELVEHGQMKAVAPGGGGVVLKTVIPARQADLAFQMEIERADRVAKKVSGSYSPTEARATRTGAPGEDPQIAILGKDGTPIRDMEPQELGSEVVSQIRDLKAKELIEVIKGTEDDRKEAEKKFKEAEDALRGGRYDARQASELARQQPQSVQADVRRKAAQTQLYASWPQAPAKVEDGTAQADRDRLSQTYFAMQGDPGFSRLFCMVIDLELTEELPEATYLFLAAEGAQPGRKTPLVWTAAKNDGQHFWPVPRNEIDLPEEVVAEAREKGTLCDLITGLDQFDGISIMGAGACDDAHRNNPRFGLSSLDMRRAAEPTGDDDVATNAGGDANAFQTAGFVILDRRRADEAIRAAARAAVVNEAKPGEDGARANVLLHADDLTVGRRLDVAVRKGGKDRWRSLMNRRVRYDFRAGGTARQSVAKALDTLIGAPGTGERRELDATSMTSVSRLVPRAKSTTPGADDETGAFNEADAVVEEAVAQWDGSPMAVLCAPERPISPLIADKAPLPFRRTLGLPDAKDDPASRPPPLRYGVGYRFAMRSTFLGGRSIPVSEDGSHLERQFKEGDVSSWLAFPPNFSDTPGADSLRRFLRQEPVGRPDILLPAHIATRSNGRMGFEQADLAVLRIDTSKEEGPEFLEGSPYVDAADRARPSSTMRIVVPPTISQDDAARHGMFDRADIAELVKGGLRDVRRDRQALDMNSETGATRPAGFPIAVTREPVGFGDTAAERRRDLVFDGSSVQGEAVFVHGKETGQRSPFLPDPAAESFVLRAKRRATGEYLEGCLEVPVYDNGLKDWPNARPIAIDIVHVPARPRPTALEDVLALEKNPKRLLNAKGEYAKAGARVTAVKMRLAPGEDYELEASCLPCVDRLTEWFALPEVLGAMAQPAGAEKPEDRLKNLFGVEAAAALGAGRAAALAEETCGCTVGGHRGPGHAAVSEIGALLRRHAARVSPLEELAAVGSMRVACVAPIPAAAPALFEGPADAKLDKAIAAVGWLGGLDKEAARGLFGKVSLSRPAAFVPAKKPPMTIKVQDLAKEVLVRDTIRGSKEYLLSGAVAIDLTDADGFELIAKVVSPRSPLIDDTSRRRSLKARRAGRWPSLFNEDAERVHASVFDVYGFDGIDDRGKVTLRSSEVTLLRCEAFPAESSLPRWPLMEGKSLVSLAMVHEAARRGVSVVRVPNERSPDDIMLKSDQVHTFPDAKARRLEVKAVAFSRFAADWQTADKWLGTWGQGLARSQPLSRSQQIRESGWTEVWLPASERPAKCVVRSPMPVIRMERRADVDGETTIHNLKRICVTRIYLSRGWFSSGEGERLGVVVWPPNLFDPTDDNPAMQVRQVEARSGETTRTSLIVQHNGRSQELETVADEYLGQGGVYVTRWGGDPIRWDGAPEDSPFIGAENFADVAHCLADAAACEKPAVQPDTDARARLERSPHTPAIVKNVLMPVGRADATGQGDGAVEMMKVSLVTYEPCFDADREEWYVDIEIKPAKATDPFVRFGLVRYQQHAAPELQVSEPVTAWAQILPTRTVRMGIKADGAGGLNLDATVTGQASERVKRHESYKNEHPIYARLDRPSMRLVVVHEGTAEGVPVSRIPVGVPSKRVPPGERLSDIDTNPHISDGQATWTLSTRIEGAVLAALGPGRCFAYLEEIERRMPATYAAEPITIDRMFDERTLVDSGPRFAARIPFDLPVPEGSSSKDKVPAE